MSIFIKLLLGKLVSEFQFVLLCEDALFLLRFVGTNLKWVRLLAKAWVNGKIVLGRKVVEVFEK
jgi:hypothetical protein